MEISLRLCVLCVSAFEDGRKTAEHSCLLQQAEKEMKLEKNK